MKKKTIFILIIVLVIFSIMALWMIFSYANKKRETHQEPYLTNNKCKEDDGYCIYKYDGKSELVTSHAVVIVGYGHEDSKYYWIIQVLYIPIL